MCWLGWCGGKEEVPLEKNPYEGVRWFEKDWEPKLNIRRYKMHLMCLLCRIMVILMLCFYTVMMYSIFLFCEMTDV